MTHGSMSDEAEYLRRATASLERICGRMNAAFKASNASLDPAEKVELFLDAVDDLRRLKQLAADWPFLKLPNLAVVEAGVQALSAEYLAAGFFGRFGTKR